MQSLIDYIAVIILRDWYYVNHWSKAPSIDKPSFAGLCVNQSIRASHCGASAGELDGMIFIWVHIVFFGEVAALIWTPSHLFPTVKQLQYFRGGWTCEFWQVWGNLHYFPTRHCILFILQIMSPRKICLASNASWSLVSHTSISWEI